MKPEIGIYMKKATFQHKLHLQDENIVPYWILSFGGDLSLEETLEKEGIRLEKVWVAYSKHWQGYFEVRVMGISGNEIELGKWVAITEPIPRSAFQGFTYQIPTEAS